MASAQPTGLRIRDRMDNTRKIIIILFVALAVAQSFLIFKGGYYDNTDSGLANFITPLHQQYGQIIGIVYSPSFFWAWASLMRFSAILKYSGLIS